MRIGELAERSGASVRSLRYYEQQGLLTSVRSSGGQRQYAEVEVERVRFIRRLLTARLPSRAIADLMPCVDRPDRGTSDAAMATMTRERARLSASIEQLVDARAALDELIAAGAEFRAELIDPAVAS